MTWAATAIVGGNIVGGYISSQGAQNAANTQAAASEQAQRISQKEFNRITAQEKPFMQGGYGGLNELDYLLGIGRPGQYKNAAGDFGSLLNPFQTHAFNMNDWKQLSPAYKFQRQQGMQGVLNGDEASVGALSGAAQKDLIGYNQNLANTSFNNAFNMFNAQQGNLFNMYQQQQGNIYDRLAGIAQLGQNAAANLGSQGTQLAGQAAQSAANIGTAQAAGQIGAANAWSNALSSSAYIPYLMQGNPSASTASTGNGWGGIPYQ